MTVSVLGYRPTSKMFYGGPGRRFGSELQTILEENNAGTYRSPYYNYARKKMAEEERKRRYNPDGTRRGTVGEYSANQAKLQASYQENLQRSLATQQQKIQNQRLKQGMEIEAQQEARRAESDFSKLKSESQMRKLRGQSARESAVSAADTHNIRNAQMASLTKRYGLVGGTKGDSTEFRAQLSMLQGSYEKTETILGQLQQQSERMDPVGRANIQKAQSQLESLRSAWQAGKLSQMEFLSAAQSVGSSIEQFNWKAHVQGPGSKIGDVIEENGVLKTRTAKGMVPTGYTADYIAQNTRPIGNTGQLLVPTAPGEKPMIVEAAKYDRDIKDERAGQAKAYTGIMKQYDSMKEAEYKRRVASGNLSPMTGDEEAELMVRAKKTFVKIQQLARSADQDIMGARENATGVPGEPKYTEDPVERGFMQGQQQQAIQREEADKQQRVAAIAEGAAVKATSPEEMQQVQQTYSGRAWVKTPEAVSNVMNAIPVTPDTDPSQIPDGQAVRTQKGDVFIKQGELMIPVEANKATMEELMRMYKLGRRKGGLISVEPR